MARYEDDDLDYKNIRPGNIDRDIFESDDSDYEIDSSDNEEFDDDDTEVEDYSKYETIDGESIGSQQQFAETENDNSKETEYQDIENEAVESQTIKDIINEANEEDNDIVKFDSVEETVNDGDIDDETDHITNDKDEVEETEKIVTETEEINEEQKESDKNDTPSIDSSIINDKNFTEQDIKCRDDLVNIFKRDLENYYKKYTERDLINYLEEFIDKDDNRKMFSNNFIMQYCKFSLAINFKDEIAKQSLWVYCAGMFADYIESKKKTNEIQSTVVDSNNKDPLNVDIIEDEDVKLHKEYRKSQDEKYAKYRIDRTIFKISDTYDEENCSIFEDKRTLQKDFYESVFYSILKEVMETDRSADMSKVLSTVIYDENTSFVPVVDYNTGVRVLCIDTNDTDQYRLNPLLISRKVPFSYAGYNNRNIKVRILYLDDAINRPVAVVSSLKKLIAFKYYKEKYKISLGRNRNYVVGYTTEHRCIEMFEKGDPDTHNPENSTYSMAKPSNMTIGVIVLDKKTQNDKRAIRRTQIMRDVGQYETPSVEDYNIQFVLSARISKNDLKLRNPAIPKNERYVEYIITQYNECNPVIIMDGFQVIVACIINEHKRNYSPGTPYAISYEYDRDGLVSPAVVGMLDEQDGVEPALNQRNNPMEIDASFIMPPSRRKMEGIYDFERGRLDKRYFSPISIQRKYDRSLWANYDLTTRDGRIQFIKSRGFEEFLHNKPVVFDVMPYALNMIESSDMIRDLVKVSISMLADKNSADTEALLFKQAELNYRKSLGGSESGKFHLFLYEAANFIIDCITNKNTNRTDS